jgi:hypothetical protein
MEVTSTMNEMRIMLRIAIVALMLGCFWSSAGAVEPEKEAIFSNTIGGLMCGTASTNQCTVPAGKRLIIEHVSGYAFLPASAKTTTAVSMVIKDAQLGLNGYSFHTFVATKTNATTITDVFVFSTPLKMMLHPQATFYFSTVVAVAVSGYLVSSK